jgi:trehalose synthase
MARLLTEVTPGILTLERFLPLLGPDRVRGAIEAAERLRVRLGERAIWNVNSTAAGGGVAEMLPSLLSYSRGHGIDTRWVVIHGEAPFFRVTKRLHHMLHGSPGDGLGFERNDHAIYEETCRANAHELCGMMRPRDVVILHDPQTAGMVGPLVDSGAIVIWRCHIGHEEPNEHAEAAWRFLLPYIEPGHAFVFSRPEYVPPELPEKRTAIIRPSIDAFSAKNQELGEDTIRTILVHTGLIEGPLPDQPSYRFQRADGSPDRVVRQADIVRSGRATPWDVPLVVQISRWDPLKDMKGAMCGFAQLVDGNTPAGAELLLAGPNGNAVADDPEGPAVFGEVLNAWYQLPAEARARIHLAMLPMTDVDENAVIVNALQRHATIVVQKSIYEGFGLTVAEAMWKRRPVVATRVGGIQDQIVDGESGVLVDDPRDLAGYARALRELLCDSARAKKLGAAAETRAREEFLGLRHLLQYASLIDELDSTT